MLQPFRESLTQRRKARKEQLVLYSASFAPLREALSGCAVRAAALLLAYSGGMHSVDTGILPKILQNSVR